MQISISSSDLHNVNRCGRSRQMTTSTTSIDIMGLQAAYANLHTDQERDYFMQRYHDVISSFGGKTSYDADNRPLLVMRSNLWASGYDVDEIGRAVQQECRDRYRMPSSA